MSFSFLTSTYFQELQFGLEQAWKVGEILEIRKNQDLDIETKADLTLVTSVDKEIAQILDSAIAKQFPNDGILNEETYFQADSISLPWYEKNRCWVLDPLDSTSSYIKKGQDYAVLIALMEGEKVVVGIGFKPAKKELFFAIHGHGAWILENHRDLHTAKKLQVNPSEEMQIVVSQGRKSPELQKLIQSLGSTNVTLQSGSMKICSVARGDFNIFVSPPRHEMSHWDLCATSLILEEAGGCITDLAGNPFNFRNRNPLNRTGVLASNKILHSQILNRIQTSTKGTA